MTARVASTLTADSRPVRLDFASTVVITIRPAIAMTAPAANHLYCWRVSPADRRKRITTRTIQAIQNGTMASTGRPVASRLTYPGGLGAAIWPLALQCRCGRVARYQPGMAWHTMI